MYTNIEMEAMSKSLDKHLNRRDIIGYAAARNKRILDEETIEFSHMRDALVAKYGEEDADENGNPTGRISLKFDSPRFPEFAEELDRFANIKSEPALFRIKYTDVVGELSGTEILEIDWMLED